MSTAQIYLPFDQSSDAYYKQWGQGISLQLDSCGWTKTSDTGQVDWTTNPARPAAGSYLYEIRQPASDSLQTGATAYYIKIEYGTQSGPYIDVRFSMGTGTNGAGTLTGFVWGPYITMGNYAMANNGAQVYECNFSWDNSRLGIMMWRTVGGYVPFFVGFERTKNTDGTDSSDGVTMILIPSGNGQVPRCCTTIFGIGKAPALNSFATIDVGNISSMSFNNSIPISPAFPCYGKFGNPLTIAGATWRSDLIEGSLLTTTLYGASRTYLASTGPQGFKALGASTYQALVMRFD